MCIRDSFSATMPKEIRRMVKDYMSDPFEVRIDPKTTVNTNIEHQFAVVHYKDKTEALTRFMDLDPELYGVVFCRTKRDTQQLAEQLIKQGYRADAIHGDLSQHQRDRVMMGSSGANCRCSSPPMWPPGASTSMT